MSDFEALSVKDKIFHWRDLRESIESIENDLDVLSTVRTYWEKVAVVNYLLDYDHPETWPTPWELIHNGYFCHNSLAYMMYYTLYFSDDVRWANRIELKLVQDINNNEIVIVLFIDNRYLLNYSYNEIIDLNEKNPELNILYEYERVKHKFKKK
jgi:hypothetical protein